MPHIVVFAPEAEAQLAELYGYIAAAASPEITARYTDRIVTYCEGLRVFPY
jgi:toxin ParE1/3/4